MSARDEAIEAAAVASWDNWCGEPWGATHETLRAAERKKVRRNLAAAVPLLLNDLADRIEYVGKGDENVAWSKGMMSAVLLVRHAAEGWRDE